MTFLAPWALVVGALGAAGMVLLHLVARQRPAAYLLPTTRFVPDRRTLVSRAATRPRDLLLLALRVLLLLAAAAAFARPVMTPSRGAIARVILVDRSRAVANGATAVARARAIATGDAPVVFVAFDSAPRTVIADSLAAGSLGARGSISAALVAARRAAVVLAERADSVELVLVSPVMAGELDGATATLRSQWPGAIRIERIDGAADSATRWHLERPVPVADALGPAVASLAAGAGGVATRLLRGDLTAVDSAFARSGGTVVRWDSAGAKHPGAEGLSEDGDVIVAALERAIVPAGRVVARWADGKPAATEVTLGSGCVRTVGVRIPVAGDIALHPSFQHIARELLAPCGHSAGDVPADSAAMRMLAGTGKASASGAALRLAENRPSPLAKWLLGLALLLALAELWVRSRATAVIA